MAALAIVLAVLIPDLFTEPSPSTHSSDTPPRVREPSAASGLSAARVDRAGARPVRRSRTTLDEVAAPTWRRGAVAERRLRGDRVRRWRGKGTREPSSLAPEAQSLRLAVRGLGGPLYVSGAGVKGLAPRTTGPLSPGAHLISIRGAGGARATVRVVRRADRLSATVSAPAGSFWQRVTCGGVKRGPSPVRGLAIGRRLACRLERDGAQLAFALSRVRP